MTKPIHLVSVFALFSCVFGQDCSDPAARYRLGVVSLVVKKTKKETGQIVESAGTGFIVSPQGFVLTADHVVAHDETIDEVKISGSIGSLSAADTPLRVVDEDKHLDIAILKFLDSSRIYTPIRLGDAFDVPIGAGLCSLGFSAPLHADYRAVVGSLSSLTGQDDKNGVENLWTTQVPSNVGESGSPVLHLPDNGVVAIKYGGERMAQNVNYVIPLNLAQQLLLTYTGIILPHKNANTNLMSAGIRLEKMTADKLVIPIGGWDNFAVRVLDAAGEPVRGAKVAWRTPGGGPLLYVSQTDDSGVASATNLYTFSGAGEYLQTAAFVSKDTPIGFVDLKKIIADGPVVTFNFQQK